MLNFQKLLIKSLESKISKTKRIILNVVSIAMMATGPILMILPGPQVISWLGLFIFILANKDYFTRFKWYNNIVKYIKFKITQSQLCDRKRLICLKNKKY